MALHIWNCLLCNASHHTSRWCNPYYCRLLRFCGCCNTVSHAPKRFRFCLWTVSPAQWHYVWNGFHSLVLIMLYGLVTRTLWVFIRKSYWISPGEWFKFITKISNISCSCKWWTWVQNLLYMLCTDIGYKWYMVLRHRVILIFYGVRVAPMKDVTLTPIRWVCNSHKQFRSCSGVILTPSLTCLAHTQPGLQ